MYYNFDEKFEKGAKRAFNAEKRLNRLLEKMNGRLPDPVNFDTQTASADTPSDIRVARCSGDSWHLGYSQRSITPENVQNYYIGGNLSVPPRRAVGVLDDIKVRAVALSDGEGRPVEVFCAVDCIGLTNSAVGRIRSELDGFCRENGVACVNVLSTHAHSSVDTMGIWSVTGKKLLKNLSDLKKGKVLTPSVDSGFLSLVTQRVVEAAKEAVGRMQPGRLYLAQIGTNSVEKLNSAKKNDLQSVPLADYGVKAFTFAKRPPKEYSPRLNRLRFVPNDPNAAETVIVNFGAHPYANGLKIKANKGNMLSADFPFYMEKVINEAGDNFIFFNAAVNGIYPNRSAGGVKEEHFTRQTEALGGDLGRLVVAMTKKQDEIERDPLLCTEGRGEAYRDAVRRIGIEAVCERELEPKMTAAHKKITLKVENPLEKLIGKLGFACFDMQRPKKGEYELMTETGYYELGDENALKIVLVPGEITPGLVSGTGDMLADNSITRQGSDFKSLIEAVGGDTAVFGLANDALGYIIPDNDYCMFFAGYGKLAEKLFFKGYAHYQEMFSIGRHTASEFSRAVENLAEEVNAHRQP